MKDTDVAAATSEPPDRVIVTTKGEVPVTAMAKLPSIPPTAVTVLESATPAKVSGTSRTILPSAGMGLVFVKATVAVPTVPATREAGVMVGSAPKSDAVKVTEGGRVVATSMSAPAAVVVLKLEPKAPLAPANFWLVTYASKKGGEKWG